MRAATSLEAVNDRIDALVALSECGFATGVLPYYLHQPDRVQGAAHFEVSDNEARSLHKAMIGRLSGYLVPKLVREVTGDRAKRSL
jgi:L-lysine 2,3-aminomutase